MAKKLDGSKEEGLKRALRFLNYRPRSEAEVRTKLTHLTFSQRVVDETLEKLCSLNLLNDESFARGWAQTRAGTRGYGPLRIQRELAAKGIEKVLVKQIIEETFGQEGGKEQAKRLLDRRFRNKDLSDMKILRRAVDFLKRRGYRDSVIAEILKLHADE